MKEQQAGKAATKPLWRRIADFPLVAMVIAVALFLVPPTLVYLLKPYLQATPPTSTFINAAIIVIL